VTTPDLQLPDIHVAIVDDEEKVRVSLRRLCVASGLRATAYGSGRELLAALDAAAPAPDCLLLDAHMPGMTGLDVLQELARRRVRLPTVVFSADDEPEAVDRYIRAGAATYLAKPILSELLLAAIGRAVGG
jgi:FixJ family two-component response regulator